MKIYLQMIDQPVEGNCAVTGKKVRYGGFGFFAEGDLAKPVSESEALKAGFTMEKKTLKRLATVIEQGIKYEEVQKAAHEEFANWRAF